MNLRHTLPREAPLRQRLPHGNGWARAQDGDVTRWSIWALTKDRKHILNLNVAVAAIELARGGRWIAAMRLRKARAELKQAANQ